VLLISAALLLVPVDYAALGAYGYLGVFLVTLLATGAIVLPVPYLVVIAQASLALDPILVALVAGLGSAIGESSGYLLGLAGRALAADAAWRRRAERWMARYGFVGVVALAFLPNPFFDATGAAAGALGYPWWRFTLAVLIGKTARFLLLGYGASAIAGPGLRWPGT
jgi:membrane protein YqaA with SNARE-associated domain